MDAGEEMLNRDFTIECNGIFWVIFLLYNIFKSSERKWKVLFRENNKASRGFKNSSDILKCCHPIFRQINLIHTTLTIKNIKCAD